MTTHRLRISACLLVLVAMTLLPVASASWQNPVGPDGSPQAYRLRATGGGDLYGPFGTPVTGTCPSGSLVCTAGGLADDEYSSCLPLGFTFQFYGANQTCIYANSNGFLSFSNQGTAKEQATPGSLGPKGVIAPFWTDLVPCSGSMRYVSGSQFGLQVRDYRVKTNVGGNGLGACTGGKVSFDVLVSDYGGQIFVNLGGLVVPSSPVSSGILLNGQDPLALLFGSVPQPAPAFFTGIRDPTNTYQLQHAAGQAPPSNTYLDFFPNHAPDAYLDAHLFEDTPTDIGIYATDYEGDEVSLDSWTAPTHGTLTPINTTVTFDASGGIGMFHYVPDAERSGDETLTIRISDELGWQKTVTLTLRVYAVNDAPTITPGGDVSVWQKAGAQSIAWASGITVGPTDEQNGTAYNATSGQTLTITTTNDNAALFKVQPALAADGTLTFTPNKLLSGDAHVTVTITDDGGTANGGQDTTTVTFTIHVTKQR